jgi:hypothetical protein
MRRVLMFCEWKAKWWKQQIARRIPNHLNEEPSETFMTNTSDTDTTLYVDVFAEGPARRIILLDDPLIEGLQAYGYRQAALEMEILEKWGVKWTAVRLRAKPIIQAVLGGDVNLGEAAEPATIELDLNADSAGAESDFEE